MSHNSVNFVSIHLKFDGIIKGTLPHLHINFQPHTSNGRDTAQATKKITIPSVGILRFVTKTCNQYQFVA